MPVIGKRERKQPFLALMFMTATDQDPVVPICHHEHPFLTEAADGIVGDGSSERHPNLNRSVSVVATPSLPLYSVLNCDMASR
ncbi:hypothetical protein [Komagataeibacter europaeus]|uniref:hypothetical protein n=1 Tax=Komagataeibacter europaeus TaxID=33995 RepID=UPI0012F730E8|nr:hypothetical protein [Komagataeibacter europaeus]